MNPTESMFLTSSYVSVPPIDTSPLKVADVPEIAPEKDPLKLDAVIIPDEFIFLDVISPVVI